MSDKGCVVCGAPRWHGPKGTNDRLTMCEEHQKQYWRDQKTPRDRQQQVKKHRQARAKLRPVRALPSEIDVLVIDRGNDRIFRLKVPIHDAGKRLSELYDLEVLIGFYRAAGHVVVEV